MMAQAETLGHSASAAALGATERSDRWWVGPLATALGLGGFIIYATFRALYNKEYHLGIGTGTSEDHAYLLSPFYSPLFALPTWLSWLSPAVLILWMPGGFRVTCYYYRKAYYRAFFLDPVGCGVGEPGTYCGLKRGKDYAGETKLLIFQNLHRYFLYIALVFVVILSADVIHSCRWPDGFGISVGTLVLLLSTTLIALYTFSCHSFRHLIGGRLDSFSSSSAGQMRYRLWDLVSRLNEHHMFWAWTSLFGVSFADFYVWMAASGTITDIRFI
jgi:hypothetical protein